MPWFQLIFDGSDVLAMVDFVSDGHDRDDALAIDDAVPFVLVMLVDVVANEVDEDDLQLVAQQLDIRPL